MVEIRYHAYGIRTRTCRVQDIIPIISGHRSDRQDPMNKPFSSSAILFFSLCLLLLVSGSLEAQVVQLPTLRFFNVRTVVSVPDGGSTSLGGVSRNASGSINRGVPGLSSVPGAGRLFRNRGIGGTANAAGSSVSARIIVMSELEEDVLAEANRRQTFSAQSDPNGSLAVQRQADFITRNLGRTQKR